MLKFGRLIGFALAGAGLFGMFDGRQPNLMLMTLIIGCAIYGLCSLKGD